MNNMAARSHGRRRGFMPKLVNLLQSSFALGVYSTIMVSCGVVMIMGLSIESEKPKEHTPAGPRPVLIGTLEYDEVCRQREQQMQHLKKRVSYIPNGYPVENYIKNSFKELGFANVEDAHHKASFVIGKSTLENVGWKVCEKTQKHNHIPGQKNMAAKNLLALSLRVRDKELSEVGGFDSLRFMKRTYLTYDKDECQVLMDKVKSSSLSTSEARKPQYIQKAVTGGHNGKGLSILDGFDMEMMLKTFKRTGKCQETGKHLVQEFLTNPLLIDGHTFNLRLYFIVFRVKPALVAFHDGYLRLTKGKYQEDSTDIKNFVSNSEKVWKKKGDSERHFMSMDELVRIISEKEGYLKDTLRPKFMRIVEYVFRAAEPNLSPSPAFFGVYGPDMTLDTQLDPWLFEVNFSPELSRFVPLQHIPNMYTDVIKAQLALSENHLTPWEDIAAKLSTPQNFHIVIDDQKQ